MADTSLDTLKQSPPVGFFASLDGVILDVQNGDLGDADTSYSYIPLVKSGFNMFSLQFVNVDATTLTIEATNDNPEVDNASANWTPATLILTSGAASSFTADGSLSLILPFPWSRLRIVRLTTNATNSVTLILTRMTM